MSYECPYCNSELIHEDTYGYLASHQSGEVLGIILRCPNHEGFENQKEALEYEPDVIEDEWLYVVCGSSCHNVSGSFYTDKNDNLKDGYPC